MLAQRLSNTVPLLRGYVQDTATFPSVVTSIKLVKEYYYFLLTLIVHFQPSKSWNYQSALSRQYSFSADRTHPLECWLDGVHEKLPGKIPICPIVSPWKSFTYPIRCSFHPTPNSLRHEGGWEQVPTPNRSYCVHGSLPLQKSKIRKTVHIHLLKSVLFGRNSPPFGRRTWVSVSNSRLLTTSYRI